MRTIAIGLVILALAPCGAAAQTAEEQAGILRQFQQSVTDYAQHHQCLDLFPEALSAAMPAPKVFTLPVAMVFRQLIARSLAERDGVAAAINGVGASAHARLLEPLPSSGLQPFPRVLQDALPPLPTPLEYRLVGHDLVIRDAAADLVVGVLHEAIGSALTVIR